MHELTLALSTPTMWLADGAMGTWLLRQGATPATLPTLPVTQSDLVLNAHLAYLQAGARLLTTQTFTANTSKFRALGLADTVATVSRKASQIARHARDIYGDPAFILGSLGPLALPIQTATLPGIPLDEAVRLYHDAVAGLVAGGVDGFLVETMSDMGTVEAAVMAIRHQSDLPILVSFAFSTLGTTLYGVTPEDAVTALLKLPGGPPLAVGANCGTGPSHVVDAVIRMADVAQGDMRMMAMPNAGQPGHQHGHITYSASPDYMAMMLPSFQAAGCVILGGCCGTTPDHIRSLAQVLATPPSSSLPVMLRSEHLSDDISEIVDETPSQTISDLLHLDHFIISVELDPPRSANPRRLLTAAKQVADAGADLINIADSPMAKVRMSAMATAHLVSRETGLQSLLHFTTRDRNLMGLQSDLLGAHALGIRNILCLTGDPPGLGDYAHATAVYDVDAVGLVKILNGFNAGTDAVGQSLGSPTHFCLGVGVNPTASDLASEVDKLRRKIDAGAQFIMTQPLYDLDHWHCFWDAMGSIPLPILLGVMPLVSYRQALYLHHEVPGITIPDDVLQVMSRDPDGGRVGLELATTMIHAVQSDIRGVYMVPSFNKVAPLLPLITALRQEMDGGRVGSAG